VINLKDAHLKPQPMPDADSDIYWRGIQEGKLLLQHCPACGHVQLYQQAICRECGSERLEHRAASGRAKVHSFSVVHRAPARLSNRTRPMRCCWSNSKKVRG